MSILFLGNPGDAKAAERAGSLDYSFDAGLLWGEVNYLVPGYGKVIALALGPNDEIYIGGHFTDFGIPELGGTDWNGIARLHDDGSLDRSFAVPVFNFDLPNFNHIDAHTIIVEDNGTVWAGFNSLSWRFRPNGSQNPQSSEGGNITIVTVYPDGRYIGGLGRYMPDGRVDSTFSGFGRLWNDPLLILRDGRLLAPEVSFIANSSVRTGFLRRHHADGTVDATYQAPDFETNDVPNVRLLLEGAKGQVYVAGEFTTVNEKPFGRLVRLNENGTVDERFRPDADLTGENAPKILAMAIQPNGKLIIAGEFGLSGGIARLNLDGTADNTFDPGAGVAEGNDGPQFPAKVSQVVVQGDGKILAAGDFKRFDGERRDGVVRLHGDPAEPLRIRDVSRVGDASRLVISGTADAVDVEMASIIGGPWQKVVTASMTNELSTEIQVETSSIGSRYFRLHRR